jgi:hypothetical protein
MAAGRRELSGACGQTLLIKSQRQAAAISDSSGFLLKLEGVAADNLDKRQLRWSRAEEFSVMEDLCRSVRFPLRA